MFVCMHAYICMYVFSTSKISIGQARRGKILIDIVNDHGSEQLIHFPTREKQKTKTTTTKKNKKTLDLILTSLPGQSQDIHSLDKFSDHDIVSGTLKVKKPRRKVYLYQKDDFQKCLLVIRQNDNHPSVF